MQISNYLKSVIIGVVLFFSVSAWADADKFGDRQMVEEAALPTVEFFNGEGEKITLDTFKGKKVVLNFWATWCGPCIAEMPAMDIIQRTLSDENVVFVPVSQDFKGLKKVEEFYTREGIKYLGKYADIKNRLMNVFNIEGVLPVTIFIDTEGNIDSRVDGFVNWMNPEVTLYLRNLK